MKVMDATQHGNMLHEAIRENCICTLRRLLKDTTSGVNIQNDDGETPLLKSIKNFRPNPIIKTLLESGADVTIADKRGITPISFCLAYSFPTIQLLFEFSSITSSYFANTAPLALRFRNAIENGKCQFELFALEKGQHKGKTLICTSFSVRMYMNNLDIRDLNVFLDQIKEYKNFTESAKCRIYSTLLKKATLLDTSVPFKMVWQKLRYVNVTKLQPTFASLFIFSCRFKNSEFIECLNLILNSPYVSFITSYFSPPFDTVLKTLLQQFVRRNTIKSDRLCILLRCVELVNVHAKDIRFAYQNFGFNEEVIILACSLKCGYCSYSDACLLDFLLSLETGSEISVDNLQELEFIRRLCYGRLIRTLPIALRNSNEVFQQKMEILNRVPSLFEISKYSLQKCIVNSYDVKSVNEFYEIVQDMQLPFTIENSLMSTASESLVYTKVLNKQ